MCAQLILKFVILVFVAVCCDIFSRAEEKQNEVISGDEGVPTNNTIESPDLEPLTPEKAGWTDWFGWFVRPSRPTFMPSFNPSVYPTFKPSQPTLVPVQRPTMKPTVSGAINNAAEIQKCMVVFANTLSKFQIDPSDVCYIQDKGFRKDCERSKNLLQSAEGKHECIRHQYRTVCQRWAVEYNAKSDTNLGSLPVELKGAWKALSCVAKLRRDSAPLYYMSSLKTGLFSYLDQVQKVWNRALKVERMVSVPPLKSSSFSDVYGGVSLCALFYLPSSVRCDSSVEDVRAVERCVLAAKNDPHWSTRDPTTHYGLPKDTPMQLEAVIDYANVECVAGFFQNFSSSFRSLISPTISAIFRPKYMSYLSPLNQALLKSKISRAVREIVVVQWKRVDSMKSGRRKPSGSRIRRDTNVSNAKDLYRAIKRNVHIGARSIYIATDEVDPKVLKQLQSYGFLTMNSMRKGFEVALGFRLNSLDAFVSEVLLSCHAMGYVSFGFSSSDCYITACRRLHAKAPYFTDIEGEISFYPTEAVAVVSKADQATLFRCGLDY